MHVLVKLFPAWLCICRISSGEGEGLEFWMLTSGSIPFHSWVRALVGRLLAVLEFASGMVDRGEGAKIDPLPETVYEYQ